MPEPYLMLPPNEDLNYENSFTLLDNLCHPVSSGNQEGLHGTATQSSGKTLHLNADISWTPSPGNTVRPDTWDAVLLSQLLLKDAAVIAVLEYLYQNGWPADGVKKLRGVVMGYSRTLADRMIEHETNRVDRIMDFNPEYAYYNAQYSAYEFHEDDEGWWIDIPASQKVRIQLSLDRAASIITTWCCCTFHFCRDMWDWPDGVYLKVIKPVDLTKYASNEPEPGDKPKKLTAKEKRAAMLAALTPEDRRTFLRKEENARELQALVRKGKVDPQDIEDLITNG